MSVYKGEGVCMYVVVWLDVVYVCMDVDVGKNVNLYLEYEFKCIEEKFVCKEGKMPTPLV